MFCCVCTWTPEARGAKPLSASLCQASAFHVKLWIHFAKLHERAKLLEGKKKAFVGFALGFLKVFLGFAEGFLKNSLGFSRIFQGLGFA